MRELATYSIETDQTVLLVFKSGEHRRVAIDDLRKHLSPSEAAQVRSGLKLRHHFLSHHMPKAALALFAGGLVAMFTLVGKPLALFWNNSDAAGPPESTAAPASQIVRSLPENPQAGPTPSPVATSSPLARPLAKSKPPKTKPKAPTLRRPSALPTTAPDAAVPTPAPSVTPAPTTDPIAILPSPSPSPIPNSGQVLGESTGPGDPSPTPVPSPAPTPTATPAP